MIRNLILKLFSAILSTKTLMRIEVFFRHSLGKGIPGNIKNEIKEVRKVLNSDTKVILDIGANYGVYTEELLKYYPKAKYFLFEPQKVTYNHLKKKFKNYPNIKIFNNGISDKNSSKLLYYDKKGSGLGSLYKRNLEHSNIKFDDHEKVELLSLSTLFKNEFSSKSFKVDFCKIDIEGHELAVLRSIKDNFEKFSLIQFEFGGCNIDSKTFFQDFWYLLKNDFNIYRIGLFGKILIKKYDEVDEAFVNTNYLAVKKI